MIFTTENSPSQINSSLLSLGRETDFKVYDYNSIINSNASDLNNVDETLDSMETYIDQTIVDTVEKELHDWSDSLNVPDVGGSGYFINSVEQVKGKLIATAKHIDMANVDVASTTYTGNTNVSVPIQIPADSKFFINLIVGPVTNSSGLTSINFYLGENNTVTGNYYHAYLEGSLYESIELNGITRVAIPINGYTTTALNYAIINIAAGSTTEVPCVIEGYYQKPLG